MQTPEVALLLRLKDMLSGPLRRVTRDWQRQSESAAEAATRATARSAAEQQRAFTRLASARQSLGIRSEQTIQREIRQTEAAYNRLARSGSLSANEQGRAFRSMTERVRELRREMGIVERSQRSMADRARSMARGGLGLAAGAWAAGQVLKSPIERTMSYDRRLAMMTNTAYADRNVAGRRAGMATLNDAVVNAVRTGGGTREGAAETLDFLLSSGSMSSQSAINLLPTLQKYATATGADPKELGSIAVRGMQSFGIAEKDVPMALDMAIKSGQEGGFELKDMAKWLPQQMAAARMSGMNGMSGLAKLLAVNQSSVITAGTKDEAGNNLVNLLAKINSKDTANDAKKLGINLSGTLARARGNGIDSLDAFVGIVDHETAKNKEYQTLKKRIATAQGGDKKAALESMADILQGSAIGGLVQDRQALMALVGYMNNREYVKKIEAALPGAKGTGQTNFDMIASTADFKTEQGKNEKAIAEQRLFTPLNEAIGDASVKLTEYAQKYPDLTKSVVGATYAIGALSAAAAGSALMRLLTAGGPAAAAASVASPGAITTVASRVATAGSILAGGSSLVAGGLMHVANSGGEAEAKRMGIDPSKRREILEEQQRARARAQQVSGLDAFINKAVAEGRMTPELAAKARDVNVKVSVELKNPEVLAAKVNQANSTAARRQ